jgi:hypothetical protein
MVGKGARRRNHLARSRQHKMCMAKATLLESQSSRSQRRRYRMVVETMYWEEMRPASVGAPKSMALYGIKRHVQPTQRARSRGIKGTNGTPKHIVSLSCRKCGIAYTGVVTKAHTCRATEPPYYSMWACNGFCSQPWKLDRQGYKGMVTTPESPAVREEGRQLLSLQRLRTRGFADATRNSQ